MKIPAIRGKIGNWDYYVSTLTFQQVNDYVSRVNDELHKSESLKDLIQRSITNNYLSIKNYIINQPEFFFNSLVLAVYNDYPEWVEIEVKYDNLETYQLGLLNFPSQHRIFPVDGQHRVEGIKAALMENPKLADVKISAIFIGHKNDDEGLKKTRRLFSTLNRYAKPVTMDDIIALDEDDAIAIVTRNLLESHPLFIRNRVTKSKNKAIPNDDKNSFTSIIALYDCNLELLKYFRKEMKLKNPDKVRDKKGLKEYLKFRPEDEELILYESFCTNYWTLFSHNFDFIKQFVDNTNANAAEKMRNNIDGGNLLFRPVGLYPFVQATLEIYTRSEKMSFEKIFKKVSKFNLRLNVQPWRQVLWNDYEKIMIMGNQTLTKLLLIYKIDKNLIKEKELLNLIKSYASAINHQGILNEDILKNL
jgi:DNA sulfur modification protein DndB